MQLKLLHLQMVIRKIFVWTLWKCKYVFFSSICELFVYVALYITCTYDLKVILTVLLDVDTNKLCRGIQPLNNKRHVSYGNCKPCGKVYLVFHVYIGSHFVNMKVDENQVINEFYRKTENVSLFKRKLMISSKTILFNLILKHKPILFQNVNQRNQRK